jgi:hypothetical protein
MPITYVLYFKSHSITFTSIHSINYFHLNQIRVVLGYKRVTPDKLIDTLEVIALISHHPDKNYRNDFRDWLILFAPQPKPLKSVPI